MDTSEQYVKMCDCEEIQRLRKTLGDWGDGDIYAEWLKNGDFLMDIFTYIWVNEYWVGGSEKKFLNDSIWLPRQDQLQAMMGEEYAINLLYEFHHFYNAKYDDYPDQFTSMEQLWLAFVMKRNYNKIWDGQDWIVK